MTRAVLLRAVFTLVVFAGRAVSLVAQAGALPPQDSSVLEQTPCHLPFPTVDAWLDDVKQRNPDLGPDRLRRIRAFFEPRFTRVRQGAVSISRLVYSSDGHRVVAFLLRPRSTPGRRHPAIIYNRGGNRDFGALDLPSLLDLSGLVEHGYVVVASQYRGVDGGDGQEEFGGADVDDVLNLLPLLGRQRDVDTTRIGMMGWSRGGMMTYLALARTDRIVAAAVGAGLADLVESAKARPDLAQEVYAELMPKLRGGKRSQPARIPRRSRPADLAVV